jgi:hypothetical protein
VDIWFASCVRGPWWGEGCSPEFKWQAPRGHSWTLNVNVQCNGRSFRVMDLRNLTSHALDMPAMVTLRTICCSVRKRLPMCLTINSHYFCEQHRLVRLLSRRRSVFSVQQELNFKYDCRGYRRGVDWIYWHNWELQVITAISPICTLYKSLAHAKSSQASLVVSWQRILTQ